MGLSLRWVDDPVFRRVPRGLQASGVTTIGIVTGTWDQTGQIGGQIVSHSKRGNWYLKRHMLLMMVLLVIRKLPGAVGCRGDEDASGRTKGRTGTHPIAP